MNNLCSAEKIGTNTCFAYIYVNMGPLFDASFYVHSNKPHDIINHLLRNYLICLTDSIAEGDWTDEADTEDARSIIDYLKANGYEEELKPILDIIHEAHENPSIPDLKAFGQKLRPLVDKLGGAMDFTVCANIIELLQFFRQYNEDTTIYELFEECLDGAELDCETMQ